MLQQKGQHFFLIPKCHATFCHERHHCYEDKFSKVGITEKSENNSPQHSHQTHTTIQQMKTYMCNKAWSQRIGGQGWDWLEGQKMGWGGGWLYL